MDINNPSKFSDKLNPENSFSVITSEIPVISVGPYGTFHDYGSFAKCFCNQCNECRVPLYTSRRIINRKYYTSRKSRLNSENSISSINKSSDSINDMGLLEMWNNACSEALKHQ
ncbi:9731_t:CDS:2 [Ambispora leptoticha]|uniref:9731_t:CDS:1 n=1 Tax=Ambispora leptoticha TaxID=144679 RepID=A0A9N9D0K3_9GLOM|nr:9731_t:CDS:2 [Ambispora leptoticha]